MLENRSAVRRTGVLDHAEPLAGSFGVAIGALPPEARFVLRLAFADAQRIGSVAGLMLDLPINQFRGEGRMAARLGPDEWLLVAPEADAEILQVELAKALTSVHHALVDVSHRNVGLSVGGARAADVINAGCPLDLGGRFPIGAASRTLFGKAEVVLFRLSDVKGIDRATWPRYRIECWRSFGRYVAGLLAEAASG